MKKFVNNMQAFTGSTLINWRLNVYTGIHSAGKTHWILIWIGKRTRSAHKWVLSCWQLISVECFQSTAVAFLMILINTFYAVFHKTLRWRFMSTRVNYSFPFIVEKNATGNVIRKVLMSRSFISSWCVWT